MHAEAASDEAARLSRTPPVQGNQRQLGSELRQASEAQRLFRASAWRSAGHLLSHLCKDEKGLFSPACCQDACGPRVSFALASPSLALPVDS